MIVCKLDVTKIDKAKLFKGKKGIYLEVVLMENRDGADQYGNDYMVVQGVSQEERAKGVKGAILGNGKKVGGQAQPRAARTPATETSSPTEEKDDLPF